MRYAAPIVLVLAAFVLAPAAAPAQPASPSFADLPRDLLADLRALPTPANGLWLLGGAALTIVVYQFEDAEGAARFLDRGGWDLLSDVGNVWGDARLQVPLALGTWGVGAWTDHPYIAATGYTMGRGLALTYATNSLIKVIVDRERPNGGHYSFPSGHTAAAFTTAGVLTRRHGPWVGAAGLVMAGLTAMGRMEDLKHWASDVTAGATLGWIIGWNAARSDLGKPGAWRLAPAPGGLALVKRF